jgi:hypothetical protein
MTTHTEAFQPDVYRFLSGVHHRARCSQELIKALATTTAQQLGKLNKAMAEDAARGEAFLASIHENGPKFTIESEEEIISNLLNAEQSFADSVAVFRDKEDAAIRDADLYGRNEEMITDAYRRSIELMITLASLTQSIRWALMEHSEDYAEQTSDPMSGDELIASLG